MDYAAPILISAIWLPQALYQVFTWVYWWQDKEYRVDRFRVLFLSKDSARKLWTVLILLKIFVISYFYYSQDYLVLISFFIFVNLLFIRRYLQEGLRRPVMTRRAQKLLATSVSLIVLAVLGIFVYEGQRLAATLLFGELSLLISPYLGILWTTPIVNRVKERETKRAISILRKVNPKVIGVTGSYGKSTTKDFVAQMLSQEYKTAKTTGSENTELGVVRKILKNVNKGTEYFVAEVGAYKKGEIEKICKIIKPKIGIITGIEPQHLELFGSLANIKSAKFELIESLPSNGVAIFNIGNKHAGELYREAQKLQSNLKVKTYSLLSRNTKADLVAEVIAADPEKIRFRVKYEKEKKEFETNLRGEHFVENLAGAVLVARELGVSWSKIEKGIRKVSPPEKTMQVINLKTGAILVDDSYNTTPKGFDTALSYLELLDGRKVVLTTGVIELGKEKKKVHTRLGKMMKNTVDKVFLFNEEFAVALRKGLGKEREKLEVVKNPRNMLGELRNEIEEGSVILLEGKMPSQLVKEIRNYKYHE